MGARNAVAYDRFPTVWRNLALAYFNKRGEKAKAVEYMEQAFRLNPSDGRVLMELDQLSVFGDGRKTIVAEKVKKHILMHFIYKPERLSRRKNDKN